MAYLHLTIDTPLSMILHADFATMSYSSGFLNIQWFKFEFVKLVYTERTMFMLRAGKATQAQDRAVENKVETLLSTCQLLKFTEAQQHPTPTGKRPLPPPQPMPSGRSTCTQLRIYSDNGEASGRQGV